MKSFWSSIKYIFTSIKSKELAVLGKIDDLRLETIDTLNQKERQMNLIFKDEKIKIKANFYAILAMAFTDLSIIEEKEWNESKELYIKAKNFLLPDGKYEEEKKEDKKEEEKLDENKKEMKEEKKDKIEDSKESQKKQ